MESSVDKTLSSLWEVSAMELKYPELQNSVQLVTGQKREIYKRSEVHIEQFRMAIESMSLAEVIHCKFVHFFRPKKLIFRPTEIWSKTDDNDDINIKVTEPSLHYYRYYPELFIVDSNFCINK